MALSPALRASGGRRSAGMEMRSVEMSDTRGSGTGTTCSRVRGIAAGTV